MTAQDAEPQVSWKVLERNASVVGADGREIAHVFEIAGDVDLDIFSGLVVRSGPLSTRRELPAERVVAIWRRRVQVDLTAEEIESLPHYEEPDIERLRPESFLERVRRRLFG